MTPSVLIDYLYKIANQDEEQNEQPSDLQTIILTESPEQSLIESLTSSDKAAKKLTNKRYQKPILK